MVATCRIYKKSCPNGKVTLYLSKREYVDHITFVDPIDGIILLDDEYLKHRHVYAHVIATFRYGREDDEVMGLKFVKELYLASEQIYPQPMQEEPTTKTNSKMQDRLLEKLGPNAYPFTLKLPENAPHSVMLQPGAEEQGQPCGVYYEVRITVGNTQHDKGHKRNSVSMAIRKVQRAQLIGNRQPCSVIKKDFLLSPGHLELEVTLDRQVFAHGEPVNVNIAVRNYSNKTVKRIKVYGIQNADICMFASGHCRTIVTSMDTESGCPIGPGGTLHKVVELYPTVVDSQKTRGLALDAPVGDEAVFMAASTILPEDQEKDPFGIIVSYSIKVKLILGALGGEVVAELPFVLMSTGTKKIAADHPSLVANRELSVESTTPQNKKEA
ncbi:arrestin homolog [Parasteatoda tepidariorum]|uniref:Arrestin-like protein n=1 Tax=Parasteatoda tepidariorum TaxID=114398 RepID=A0A2L2Y754_PARTP|nr:arrestin homolog [Parasteatoda tepidariorum]XP_042908308.1 arrestin homolog [Parasteatoda tepidariorum]